MASDTHGHVDTSPGQHARWSMLAALGLFMVGLAAFAMVLAVLVWGLDTEGELPFFVTLIVVPWIGAFLAWRFGTWSKVVSLILGLAAIALLWWTAFSITLPGSFFDFLPAILVVPGALIAIVASIAAIVAKRRGHMSARPEGGERRAINVVVAVVGALAVISGVLTVAGRESVDASAASAEVELENFEYDQPSYEVPSGTQVVVRNGDPFHHTFTIDSLDVDVDLGPGGQALVDIPAQPGTYVVYCRPHTSDPEDPSDTDMASVITVT